MMRIMYHGHVTCDMCAGHMMSDRTIELFKGFLFNIYGNC